MPSTAHAGIIADVIASITHRAAPKEAAPLSGNVQTIALPQPATNLDPAPDRGGGDVTIVDDTALLPAEGPSGTIADIERTKNAAISVYVVREGDTLSGIAKMFGVSASTILWANDLPAKATLTIGQKLTILPVTGVKYAVKKGDTLASIAKKFGGDADEIASFNGLEGPLAAGAEIIIPDGEVSAPVPARPSSTGARVSVRASVTVNETRGDESGYYIAPLSHYRRSQGIHGYNGVDLAAPVGTPIRASATGEVIVAKGAGWNGGYGEYVVIQHSNGSQTLYSHLSKVSVGVGDHVAQGETIGSVGSTGKSTGAHVHFEIRNGIRNPF